ncbi:MAG: hypothetical protein HY619_02865 [Thaumarchaeota archaeon]|nr:hypothetical protein [Nitrososphaerota archaeon]
MIDAGMGYGEWGYAIRCKFPDVNFDIRGFESYDPAIKFAKNLGSAYSRILEIDLATEQLPLPDKWADFALCLGVLAHLTKDGGLHLIKELERTSRHILITAPTSLYQHEGACNSAHIESLRHKSSWSVGDFTRLGFEIRGFGLRGRSHTTTYFDYVLSPFVYRIPWLAGGILAWK